VVSSVQISGLLCVILEHTRVSGVECLSGSLCVVLEHARVSGGMSKWLAQFK